MVRGKTIGNNLFDIINTIFMCLIFIGMLYPFIYVINASVTDVSKAQGSLLLLPKVLDFSGYQVLLKDESFLNALLVSIARSIIGPVLMLIVTGMAAYVLAQPNLVCGKFLRLFFVLTMYVNAGIIPNYIFMKNYGLLNNFWVYILPTLCSAFNLILMRTYIESIPKSLQEAVYVDGGNDFQAYWKVIFPVCKPINAAILLFGIIQQWNSFMDTQMYCTMEKKLHTLQYVLYTTLASVSSLESMMTGMVKVNGMMVKMAITVITIVPIMCVYPFLHKYFASGIMLGSVKA